MLNLNYYSLKGWKRFGVTVRALGAKPLVGGLIVTKPAACEARLDWLTPGWLSVEVGLRCAGVCLAIDCCSREACDRLDMVSNCELDLCS